jgi:hypothetical protein
MTTTNKDKRASGTVAIGGFLHVCRPSGSHILRCIEIGQTELSSGLQGKLVRPTGQLKWLVCQEELGNLTRHASPLTP